MKAKLAIFIILASCAFLLVETAKAQTNSVKIHFRVDNKEVIRFFRVEVSFNSSVFKPKVRNGNFTFPAELLNEEKVDLRFISGKYDLDFKDIPLKKFYDIVINIDNKPFEEENLPSNFPTDKKLVFIYSISYGTTELIYHTYK